MNRYEAIDDMRQAAVVEATHAWIARAGAIFGRRFEPIPVLFDLMGRAAGMYRVRRGERVIRYNPYLFAKYPHDSLSVTVPHEVAHYVTDRLYGLRRVRPHGREWRAVMQDFGVDPSAASEHDLEGIPTRAQRRHAYRCACLVHPLTTRRHNLILHGARYRCRRCGDELFYSGQLETDTRGQGKNCSATGTNDVQDCESSYSDPNLSSDSQRS
ncbi:MAG: SprT-like domain-containing protein [Gammaproteobacteria bacterium]|nr:SprT-like domain-containing protein [Gammaproteobacteria bacterium]